MSAKSEELEGEGTDEVCASCGIAAIDDVTLKDCDGGCDLVKYCGDGCQINHREQHEDECKQRVDNIHDKQLFTQPDISYMGECPICCLPLSIDSSKSTMMPCCCKWICNGCNYANQKREMEGGLERRCPFCREPMAESDEEYNKNVMERVKKNDPVGMTRMGKKHYHEGEYGKAFEYLKNAAELGDAAAHGCLGRMHYQGEGVEKDMQRGVFHFEQAAIRGHPQARGYLALHDKGNGRFERAAKHYIIAANLGDDLSLKRIKDLFVKFTEESINIMIPLR